MDWHQGRGEGVVGRGVSTPHTNFQSQEKFEKYYKRITLCSVVCLELSFKASVSLKFPIFLCGALPFIQAFLKIGTNLRAKIYS